MSKRIEIKPNDQTHVGKKITKRGWGGEFATLLFVGNTKFFIEMDGHELACSIINTEDGSSRFWDLYEELEKPKKKRLARALFMLNGYWEPSRQLFSNKSEAFSCFRDILETPNNNHPIQVTSCPTPYDYDNLVIWPANDGYWVEVEE
jgi:hypothetical protein